VAQGRESAGLGVAGRGWDCGIAIEGVSGAKGSMGAGVQDRGTTRGRGWLPRRNKKRRHDAKQDEGQSRVREVELKGPWQRTRRAPWGNADYGGAGPLGGPWAE
jgi:hypothetical protein